MPVAVNVDDRTQTHEIGELVAGYFPRATGRRGHMLVAVGTALLMLAAVPLASADDLRERKKDVERNIGRAQKELDQSSTELLASVDALKQARSRLSAARAQLSTARGQVAAAEAFDLQMQQELKVAVAKLKRARARLADSRRRLAGQEERLRTVAVQHYQGGDPGLMALSMVLTSQDTDELTTQLEAARSIMDKEAGSLARLEASQAILSAQEAEVEAAKAEVARQRRAAAENLERKRQAEAEAARAKVAVRSLVQQRANARDVAASAKAKDLAELQELEVERDRVAEMLRKRAEEARRRAEEARRRAEEARRQAQVQPRVPATTSALLKPVDGYITSSYGMRFHPVYRRWSLHDGTDFGASCGTPIRASEAGRVIARYFNSSYGNRVIIDHGYRRGVGLGTAYNHLSAYSTYVGQRVGRGDVIGYVGNTGASTGCHLHFMVFENGATVNPMKWL
jgi:murein DD-endopeptidase MepM/ murein hydrolase activator NlpD